MTTDPESDRAAAHLYRLAQATAMIRSYTEHEGRAPDEPQELARWAKAHPAWGPREPSDAVIRALESTDG